ncbi:MAG: response regulator [Bacteroidales bacterium]|nr:response regulator [Bacteroidales bacterium]
MGKNILHICNVNTPKTSDWQNISSIATLNEKKEDSDTIYLLNIHLTWEGNKLSNNYGFDVANLIRTEKKSKAPIIFYSPIQPLYFETKSRKEIKYKILFGRGSAFIDMPFKDAALLKLADAIEPLSNAALHDVATMLCDLKGIVIDKLNHDLKFEADVNAVIASISPYLSKKQKEVIGLDAFIVQIKSIKKGETKANFDKVKRDFINTCIDELTEAGKDKLMAKATKHKVLVIDDLQTEIENAKSFLKEDFIVAEATTGSEAIRILKKDIKNEIVAVISDWRLFTDENQNYWQPLQGYEVLDFAAKNGIRSLFALTSQADFVVHHLRNLMGIRFSMFKKENLKTPDQGRVFSDVLFEACEQTVQLRCAIPKSVNWVKSENKGRNANYTSLNQQYIEKWNAENRDTYFNSVEEMCNDIWTYLELVRPSKYKGVFTLKAKYDLTLSPTKPELFPVLIFRRIWMALWYSKNTTNNLSRESITESLEFCYEVMFTGMSKKYESNSPGVELNKLCLLTNEILAGKMLPEEKDWLIKQGLLEIE